LAFWEHCDLLHPAKTGARRAIDRAGVSHRQLIKIFKRRKHRFKILALTKEPGWPARGDDSLTNLTPKENAL
jgi:hypothetical protein